MTMRKICHGCFAEWESDNTQCSYCGWDPDKAAEQILGWKTGDVFDKRYLVGELYYITEQRDVAAWRIYDDILGVSCFAVLVEDDDRDHLRNIAAKLNKEIESNGIVIQAIKNIDKRKVLLFSLRDKYMNADVFQGIIETEIQLEDGELPEPDNETAREHVLTAGSILDDRYRIIDCIGIGGFGITYMCEDIFLHRIVGIKEYYPAEWVDREETYVCVKTSDLLNPYRYGMQSFMKEIKITAKFMHVPHMVTIYDAFMANDTVYMVMEFILGISIGRELRTKGYKPYDITEVVDVVLPVMNALEEMHNRRIIHSDVSPGNIMVTERREIYLIDMGAAKYNLETQPPLSAAFLKIDYAAPEQYRTAREGKASAEGPWTDIYALGATMYYMLTGIKPPDVISRLNGKDADLTEGLIDRIPVVWMELLQKMMELEPKNRISTIPALRQLIESIV